MLKQCLERGALLIAIVIRDKADETALFKVDSPVSASRFISKIFKGVLLTAHVADTCPSKLAHVLGKL